MQPNKLSVLFFGQLAEYTGQSSLELSGIEDTEAARQLLLDLYPKIRLIPFLLALDKEIVSDNIKLTGNHTLALLPPYAGG